MSSISTIRSHMSRSLPRRSTHTMTTSTVPKSSVTIRRETRFTPAELEKASEILRDGFWTCNSPVLRFRAYNDHQALLELMRSRVKAAAGVGGLVLAYTQSEGSGSADKPSDVEGGGEEGGELVGAVIVSLPGEGFTQLQKNYGDRKETNTPVKKADSTIAGAEETEAQRKTRIWVETDLVPWFNDFSNRSYGTGKLEESLYISLFAMRTEYQGKGMGREVMRQVMQWGDGEGWEMTLVDHEPELVKFYSSFGFREVGKEVRGCNGTDVTWWAMKRLRPDSE